MKSKHFHDAQNEIIPHLLIFKKERQQKCEEINFISVRGSNRDLINCLNSSNILPTHVINSNELKDEKSL